MKRINRQLSLAVSIIATSAGTYADDGHLNKPKSMKELWEIIQAQQKTSRNRRVWFFRGNVEGAKY